jgi:prepilin-type N-terminal cleavage/methylation domain-containing protein
MKYQAKGFTLIELLVVIAIVAILSVVVILVLNPAELLRQSRDSNRISDMSTLRSALSLYLADVTSPTLAPDSTHCFASTTSTVGAGNGCGGRFTIALTQTVSTATTTAALRKIDGSGWAGGNGTTGGPVLSNISSGSPISQLPLDPTDVAPYYYAYAASTTFNTFIFNSHMESVKYKSGGSGDVESTDGGSSSTLYEVGTAPGLNL